MWVRFLHAGPNFKLEMFFKVDYNIVYFGEFMKNVFVVTGTDLGWDCVVGAFCAEEVTGEELEAAYPHPEYIITEVTVQTNLQHLAD